MPAPKDPVPIYNGSGEDIPSHAVVEPTGVVVGGAMTVRKPTRDGFRGVWVNTEGAVPAGGWGQATRLPGVTVLADGSPAVGDEWGARAGSWKLGDVGGGGFVVNSEAVGGRVNAVRYGVAEPAAGSGSGRNAGTAGDTPARCGGVVYSRTSSRVAAVGSYLVQYTRLETLEYDSAGCLSLTLGHESSAVIGCIDCGGGSGSGSGSSGGGTFPTCGAAPSTLDWSSTSDIACLSGKSGTITKSGATWSNGNNLSPPCSTDNGFTVTCTGEGTWAASVDLNAATLIDQTSTSLTFQYVSDGSGTVPAGTVTFVVTIP